MNIVPELKNVICYGEILWDMLPGSTKPGGAPMNVAYHLNKQQVNAQLISRTGRDAAGEKLRSLLTGWGLPVEHCGTDHVYATSEVHASVSDNHEVSYEILFPVAWDFIPFKPGYADLVAKADALVFGSLVTRNDKSRDTLYKLLETSAYNVFDVNLRAPHYNPDIIEHLLHKTNLLKLNQQELELITNWFSDSFTCDADRIHLLQDRFGIQEIIVTKGSRGASYFTPIVKLDCAACMVEVADTVGSGDAFLAGFLAKRLQLQPVAGALAHAAALAGFVTQNSGACPDYTLTDLENFKADKEKKFDCLEEAFMQMA